MPKKYLIQIDDDGKISINEGARTVLRLDTQNPDDWKKLPQLPDSFLEILKRIASDARIPKNTAFIENLNQTIQQKNVVMGGINNVETVNIGDRTNYVISLTPKIPKELTAILPRINPDEIVGRKTDLDELRQLLFDNKKVVLVNGLGGIGKTIVAQAYVHKFYDKYAYLAWITETSDDFLQDVIQDRALIENLHIDAKNLDPPDIFNQIMLKMRNIESSQANLLVIDNAEFDLEKHIEKLPSQPNWHVLVTSRRKIAGFHEKELGFLSEAEAIALFRKHCALIDDENDIRDLVRAVDYHTLTIEILARTAEKRRISVSELKDALRQDAPAPVKTRHSHLQKIDRITSYLESIFNFSGLNDEEKHVLQQFACLPAEFHSFATIEELFDEQKNLAETINELVDYGFILHNRENDAYKMHLIINEVVCKRLPIRLDDAAQIIANITEKLSIDQSKDNPVDKFPFVPFGRAILKHFQDDQTPQIAELQNNLGIVTMLLGDYQGAKPLLEKAVRSYEKNLGPDHPNTARSYSNLALVLKDLGDYQGAKTLLEKAMKSAEKNFGADHPNTARSYSNLATVLRSLGDYQGAKQLLEKAMKSAEKNFGADHPNTAITYSNLALVLQDLGDYQGAKQLLEKAVRSDEKNFGADHPTTAVTYSNLSTVLRSLGDYQGAKKLLEKALKIFRKNLPTNHPYLQIVENNLKIVIEEKKAHDRS